MSVRKFLFPAFAPAILLICGCGDPTADIHGTVSHQGKLLKGGNITFIHQDGKSSLSFAINEDGTYKAMKVPAGEVKICVETESLNPGKVSKKTKYSPPPGQTAPEGFGSNDSSAKRYMKIPDSYSKPDSTDLKLTVGSGTMEHNVELR
jgi:hypothetical protein